MNATVAMLTTRTVLGRRRTVLLLLLPLVLLALCTFARVFAAMDDDVAAQLGQGLAADLLGGFGLAVLLPLLGLIAGTGAIGSEIDDGSIVYLLAKPLNRFSIVLTKLVVAFAVVTAFGAVPVVLGGLIMTGELGELSLGFGAGSAAGRAFQDSGPGEEGCFSSSLRSGGCFEVPANPPGWRESVCHPREHVK